MPIQSCAQQAATTCLLAELRGELLAAQVVDGLVHPGLVLQVDELVRKHAAALMHPQRQQVALGAVDGAAIHRRLAGLVEPGGGVGDRSQQACREQACHSRPADNACWPPALL
jgi:hypothetical protein